MDISQDQILWIIANLEDDTLVKLYDVAKHQQHPLFITDRSEERLQDIQAKIRSELETRGWELDWLKP